MDKKKKNKMRLSFYVACTMALVVDALQLTNTSDDGLSGAIQMDSEFDNFMFS